MWYKFYPWNDQNYDSFIFKKMHENQLITIFIYVLLILGWYVFSPVFPVSLNGRHGSPPAGLQVSQILPGLPTRRDKGEEARGSPREVIGKPSENP